MSEERLRENADLEQTPARQSQGDGGGAPPNGAVLGPSKKSQTEAGGHKLKPGGGLGGSGKRGGGDLPGGAEGGSEDTGEPTDHA